MANRMFPPRLYVQSCDSAITMTRPMNNGSSLCSSSNSFFGIADCSAPVYTGSSFAMKLLQCVDPLKDFSMFSFCFILHTLSFFLSVKIFLRPNTCSSPSTLDIVNVLVEVVFLSLSLSLSSCAICLVRSILSFVSCLNLNPSSTASSLRYALAKKEREREGEKKNPESKASGT